MKSTKINAHHLDGHFQIFNIPKYKNPYLGMVFL